MSGPTCAAGSPPSSSTSTRTPIQARYGCCGRSRDRAATWSSWATPTKSHLRVPGSGCARHPRLPCHVSASVDGSRACAGGRARHDAPGSARRLLTASRRVAAPRESGSVAASILPTDVSIGSATRVAAESGLGPGRVEVVTYSPRGAEAEHVADLLRRAHLEDGIPWSEIAVLVRSGMLSIPGLRRALVGAGVPVQVAGDEVPLRAEPAVQPLLEALAACHDLAAMSVETAQMLVASPLADIDAASLRRLGRALRRSARAAGDDSPPSSAELIRRALVEPLTLADLTDATAPAVRRLGDLLAQVVRHGPRPARRGRQSRAGAVDALAGQSMALASARCRRARWGSGSFRQPRPRLGLCAVRRRRPVGGAGSRPRRAPSRSSTPCPPRRSRPTRSPSAASEATPCGC